MINERRNKGNEMPDYYDEQYEHYDIASVVEEYHSDIANIMIEEELEYYDIGLKISRFIHLVRREYADKNRNIKPGSDFK